MTYTRSDLLTVMKTALKIERITDFEKRLFSDGYFGAPTPSMEEEKLARDASPISVNT